MLRNCAQLLGTLSVALMLILVPGGTLAGQTDDVTNTAHNFSGTRVDSIFGAGSGVLDYGEVCVYCHTPHGGSTDAPLWNRSMATTGYQMYNSTSPGAADINMAVDAQPTGVSLACLSCHDGTIGIDVITNVPNAYTGSTVSLDGDIGDFSTVADLTQDLRNDHPISVVYSVAADSMFKGITAVTSTTVTEAEGGLRLYDGDKVQCASCHNPHSTAATFLRKLNTNSGLCRTCHIK